MPTNPCSPNLALTSPIAPGATSESVLAHRPPPYGGEHAAEPASDHHTNTTQPGQMGEHKGEVNRIKQEQTNLLLQAATVAKITGDPTGTLAVLLGSPRWRELCAQLTRLTARRG